MEDDFTEGNVGELDVCVLTDVQETSHVDISAIDHD